MANPEHVKVVRQGADAIAEWRRQNPDASLDLRRAHLRRAQLRRADLNGANLRGANLARAELRGAKLRAANLTNADLRWADLTGANLRGANLSWAKLIEARLVRADLDGADLWNTDLTQADLSGANLSRARPVWARLTAADLTGAWLLWTHVTWCELAGARLTGANLGPTSLSNCDLSRATGLSAANQQLPSSIGVDTLILSFRGAGNMLTPELETFFLGAGVPKELLAELPRIVRGVEYYSCFIAYGQPDVDFAKKVRGDLAARGVPCWLYDLDATPGERTWPEIRKKQREADKMVVVCSAAALIRDGVLKEIEEQIDEEPDKMVPISRDNLWTEPGFQVMRAGRDLKPFLLDKNYADFSDDSRYEEPLQRLLKALRRKAE